MNLRLKSHDSSKERFVPYDHRGARRNTTAGGDHGQHGTYLLPFFDVWTSTLKLDPEGFVSKDDIHSNYISFVKTLTKDPVQQHLSLSSQTFGKRLRTIISSDPRFKGVANKFQRPKQGYSGLAPLEKLSRGAALSLLPPPVLLPSDTQGGIVLTSANFQPPFQRIDTGTEAGKGVFATRHLPPLSFVCEYQGYEVPKVEGVLREDLYKNDIDDNPVTMVLIGSTMFDGSRNEKDMPLPMDENHGAQLNHAIKSESNCKLTSKHIKGKLRLFIFTTTSVSKGAELIWDYGDRRRNVDNWMKESRMKYLVKK